VQRPSAAGLSSVASRLEFITGVNGVDEARRVIIGQGFPYAKVSVDAWVSASGSDRTGVIYRRAKRSTYVQGVGWQHGGI
jgi:hypothetical protein